MKKNLLILGLMVCSMSMMAQDTQKQESWYFKLGGSYFMQTIATEFPIVGGQLANEDVYAGGVGSNKLISRESVTGSFGEGFRTGISAGYRFNARLGVEMAANYYLSSSKTMAQTTNKLITVNPTNTTPATFVDFTANGQIKAFDLAPSLVFFLGEKHGFEPYSKVGIIVPIHGDLTIKTDRTFSTFVGPNKVATTQANSEDVVKPNPTVGFMAALGTSYKVGKNISLYAELEYRNFTVHGKTKETKSYDENGVDKLNTNTSFRAASESATHTNYVDHLDLTSNNKLDDSSRVIDTTKPMDELSSYVGISGLGLTFGVKFSL